MSYNQLKQAQRSLQVDSWLLYFADVVMKAQEKVEELIEYSLQITKFFDSFSKELNER